MTVTAVAPVPAHAGASREELALMREAAARLAALAPGTADRLGALAVPFTRTQEGSQPDDAVGTTGDGRSAAGRTHGR